MNPGNHALRQVIHKNQTSEDENTNSNRIPPINLFATVREPIEFENLHEMRENVSNYNTNLKIDCRDNKKECLDTTNIQERLDTTNTRDCLDQTNTQTLTINNRIVNPINNEVIMSVPLKYDLTRRVQDNVNVTTHNELFSNFEVKVQSPKTTKQLRTVTSIVDPLNLLNHDRKTRQQYNVTRTDRFVVEKPKMYQNLNITIKNNKNRFCQPKSNQKRPCKESILVHLDNLNNINKFNLDDEFIEEELPQSPRDKNQPTQAGTLVPYLYDMRGARDIPKYNSMETALTLKDLGQLQHLGSIGSKRLPTTTALYDTGATLDVMSYKYAEKHYGSQAFKKRARHLQVNTAKGIVTFRDFVEDTIQVGDRICHVRFYLIKAGLPYKVILGRSTLSKLGFKLIQIDVHGNVIYPKFIHEADLSHLALDNNDPYFDRLCYPLETQPNQYKKPSKDTLTSLDIGEIPDPYKNRLINFLSKIPTAQHEVDAGDLGKEFEASITLKSDARPFYLKQPYRMHHELKDEAKRQLQLLLNQGYITDSNSQWAHGVTTAQKKNGELRICFDYRPLNLRIEDIRGVMPTLEDLLGRFHGKHYISSLDLKSGYWHIPIAKKDRAKTAFIVPWGDRTRHLEWTRLPFGIKTAPIIFQKTMEKIFKGLDFVLIYLDDICVLSNTLKEHEKHLQLVFERLRQYNLKLRLDKCEFFKNEVTYLGYRVNAKTYRPTKKFIGKILNFTMPSEKKHLEAFLGLLIWIARFIKPDITKYTQPLYQLIRKNVPWHWGNRETNCFKSIMEIVRKIEQLHVPNLNKPFYIETDASYHSIGAVLMQKDDNGELYPVEWCSKMFNQQQQNWDIGEKECFAVVYAIEKWSPFLYQHFTVYTDHKNLAALFNHAKHFRGNKFWRWALRLQEYSFEVVTRPGTEQIISDYLSRYAVQDPKTKDKVKPPKVIRYIDNNDLEEAFVIDTHIIDDHIINLYKASREYSGKLSPKENNEFLWLNTHVSKNTTPTAFLPSIATLIAYYTQPLYTNSFDIDNSVIYNELYPLYVNNPSNNSSHQYPLRSKGKKFVHKTVLGYDKPSLSKIQPKQKSWDPIPLNKTINKTKTIDPTKNVDNDSTDIVDPTNWLPETGDEIKLKKDDYVNWVKYTSSQDQPLPPDQFLKDRQLADPILFNLRRFVETKNTLFLYDLPKYTTQYRKELNIKNEILYWKKRIYVPCDLRKPLIQHLHEQYFHVRSGKLPRILGQSYYWPHMEKDITNVLDSCEVCYRANIAIPRTKNKLTLFPATRVFEVVHIDLVGPFEMTQTGFKYILTICDRLSRYLEMVELPNMRADTVVQAFINRWLIRYGCPEAIISDQGKQFEGLIFTKLLTKLKIKKLRTTAYRPQTNGRLERMHREIKSALRSIATQYDLEFSDKDKVGSIDDWTQYLPMIQYRLNTTPSNILGCSPIELILGFKPKLPEEFAWALDANKQIKFKHGKHYLKWLRGAKEAIRQNAIKQQDLYNANRKRFYDKQARLLPFQYQIGDRVFYKLYRSTKVQPQYSVPHFITKIQGNVVTLRPAYNPKANPVTVNIDHLLPSNPAMAAKIRSIPSFEKEEKMEEVEPTPFESEIDLDPTIPKILSINQAKGSVNNDNNTSNTLPKLHPNVDPNIDEDMDMDN